MCPHLHQKVNYLHLIFAILTDGQQSRRPGRIRQSRRPGRTSAADEGVSDCEVFSKNHAAPFSKVLSFYRREPFALEAYYNNPKELPYPDPTIGQFNVQKVVPQPSGESSKVKVKVRVNVHGVFSVSSASLVEVLKTAEGEEPMETDTPAKEDEIKTSLSSRHPYI
ncbi:unnamed protein product [Leuciscus chuanchicus]